MIAAWAVAVDRMERPGRAVEGGDAQPARRERVGERDPLAPVAEQLAEAQVGCPRLPAAGDLDRAAADPRGQVQGVLEREVAETESVYRQRSMSDSDRTV